MAAPSRRLNITRMGHWNLDHLKMARKLNQQQILWSLLFACFNFQVTYRPGGCNQRADALSRKLEYTWAETR